MAIFCIDSSKLKPSPSITGHAAPGGMQNYLPEGDVSTQPGYFKIRDSIAKSHTVKVILVTSRKSLVSVKKGLQRTNAAVISQKELKPCLEVMETKGPWAHRPQNIRIACIQIVL